MTATYDMYRMEDGTYCLPSGIYFGLSEEIYHSDTALGSTSIKELAKQPCKWQYDRLRPRKEIEPEYLKWGHAWHCRVLEGKDEFDSRFCRIPTPADFPGCMVTTDDVKDFLRANGQKLTGTKADLIARAKELDDCPPVFDELLSQWRADHPKHEELSPRIVQEVEDAVFNMERHSILNAVMKAGSLINGAAELSIFYEVDGIRRKARFDYAIPPAGGRTKSLIVDLKSFTTFKGGNDEDAAIRKVYDEVYDVQAAYYMDAYRHAKALMHAGLIFGSAPAAGYLSSFLEAPSVDWVWVMMRRDAGMIPVILSIDTEDKMFEHATRIISDALDTYRGYMDIYGPKTLWAPLPKAPLRLNASVMPTYNRGVQYEQPINR